MASDDKKIKTSSVPKNEPSPKKESTASVDAPKADGASKSDAASKPDATSKADATPKPDATPTDGDGAAASPSGFSRGEGQKPVTQAYKDNWNAIFAKKKKRR